MKTSASGCEKCTQGARCRERRVPQHLHAEGDREGGLQTRSGRSARESSAKSRAGSTASRRGHTGCSRRAQQVNVVDASAVVDALTLPDGAEAIHNRISGESLHAPHILDVEVVSGLRGLVLGGDLSDSGAMDALTDYEDLDIERWPATDDFRRRAFELRHNFSAFDAAYVALAEALQCPVITRDHPLSLSGGHDAVIEVW